MNTTTKSPIKRARCSETLKLARRGVARWYSADAMSLARITHLQHLAEHVALSERTSTSTIICRALAVYVAHMERLKGLADSHPKKERLLLIEANRGDVTSIPEELLTAVPVRTPLMRLLPSRSAYSSHRRNSTHRPRMCIAVLRSHATGQCS